MIGIIGFGRFGELIAKYLAEDFKVLVYNRSDKKSEIQKIGAYAATLQEVCLQDIIILSVPISIFKNVLKEIAVHLKQNTLVIDVCSVKEYPVKWMKEFLPEGVFILATHPMFGPDSAAASIKGKKMVLCRERIEDELYQKIKSYLYSKDLVLIETTPQDHDKQIAVSLSLTHFIGRSLSEFGAVRLDIDTEGYKRLLHILGVVEHDTMQLFLDMHRYNPYAGEKRSEFMAAMKRIDDKLNNYTEV